MASEMLNAADSLYLVHRTEVYTGYFMFVYGKQNGIVFWEVKVASSLNIISKMWQCHEERGMCQRACLPGMLLALKTNATSACLWAILHSIVVQMLFGSAFPNQLLWPYSTLPN